MLECVSLTPRKSVQMYCRLQVETGNPYMLYKDSCNRKSNQQNLGTIKCSNLCTEIVEYTSAEETAVCNLASIALPRYVREREAALSSGRPKLTGSLNAVNRYDSAHAADSAFTLMVQLELSIVQ